MDRAAKKSPPKDPGGHKWKGPLPKGWTDASRKKFWNSLTSAAPKHKVTECIKRMDGKVSNPGAFCASLADRSIPGWRQEAAKERRKKKAELAFTREERHEYGRCALEWSKAEGTTDPLEKVATAMRLAGCAVKSHQPDELRKSAAIFRAVTAPGLSQTQPLRTRRDYGEEPEVEEDEPPYSQVPGTDNLPMEEDHRVAARADHYFRQEVGGKKFRHPQTGNQVKFDSLPSREQSKIYQQWSARQEESYERVKAQNERNRQESAQPKRPGLIDRLKGLFGKKPKKKEEEAKPEPKKDRGLPSYEEISKKVDEALRTTNKEYAEARKWKEEQQQSDRRWEPRFNRQEAGEMRREMEDSARRLQRKIERKEIPIYEGINDPRRLVHDLKTQAKNLDLYGQRHKPPELDKRGAAERVASEWLRQHLR